MQKRYSRIEKNISNSIKTGSKAIQKLEINRWDKLFKLLLKLHNTGYHLDIVT